MKEYARSIKGERAHDTKPFYKGENITTIGALGMQGISAAMTVDGGTTGEVFSTYVEEVLCPTLRPGQIVIMDNLSSHKVKGIEKAIKAKGATLLYGPPYSPDLSPIEYCWSKVKEYLRKHAPRTRHELDRLVNEAFELITFDDIVGWFCHCGFCI